MTQLAMVHISRRKESWRRWNDVANLDASELRLKRAKNDVQIVQSYTLLRTALQDIRTTNGACKILFRERIEDQMADISTRQFVCRRTDWRCSAGNRAFGGTTSRTGEGAKTSIIFPTMNEVNIAVNALRF